MTWRPDDWKNRYDEECRRLIERAKEEGHKSVWLGESGAGNEAYEEGADALLEAVVEWGERKCLDHQFPPYPKRFNCPKCMEQLKE